jgi:DNA-binding NarL/FixJ family response regulator
MDYTARWTRRQREIVELAAHGKGDKEIARSLGISPGTVRGYFHELYQFHGIPNRAAAVALYIAQKRTDVGWEPMGRPVAR